ncbi:hypothetical protein D3C85_457120 [compost metagenome]
MADEENPVVKEFLAGSANLIHQVLNEDYLPPKEFDSTRLRYFDLAPTDLNDRNTVVTVEGIPRKGYWGNVVQYYNRLDIAQFFPTLNWQTPLPITPENVYPYLKAATKLDLSVEDIEHFDEIIIGDGDEVTVNINMSPLSLQWIGTVAVTIKFGPSWLNLMISRIELDVLRHPSKKYDKPYGRMVSWGYDFSFHYDDLRPNKTGYMTSYNNLVATTNKLGFPPFANGKLSDLPTSSVPDANPEFERVFVMTTPGGSYTGPLYFHYNPY